jgi:hypothetical protein
MTNRKRGTLGNRGSDRRKKPKGGYFQLRAIAAERFGIASPSLQSNVAIQGGNGWRQAAYLNLGGTHVPWIAETSNLDNTQLPNSQVPDMAPPEDLLIRFLCFDTLRFQAWFNNGHVRNPT